MSDMEQRNAPSQTAELWAEVFAHLELRPDNIDMRDQNRNFKHRLNQKEVHRVKLVCKHFKEIHASQPSLVQRLYIGHAFAVSPLPSLQMWLPQRKSSLQMFQSTSPNLLLDIVLSCLESSESSIKLVDVLNVSARSISVIATLTRLGKCALGHSGGEHLELSPLGGLPKLIHLGLEGNFKGLHHLRGLTRLECFHSEVLGVQAFATTLQYLQIDESKLLGVQEQGFAACTALTQLVLIGFYIDCFVDNSDEDKSDDEIWVTDMFNVPHTSFGFPTQLERLQISTGKSYPAGLDLKPRISLRVEYLLDGHL